MGIKKSKQSNALQRNKHAGVQKSYNDRKTDKTQLDGRDDSTDTALIDKRASNRERPGCRNGFLQKLRERKDAKQEEKQKRKDAKQHEKYERKIAKQKEKNEWVFAALLPNIQEMIASNLNTRQGTIASDPNILQDTIVSNLNALQETIASDFNTLQETIASNPNALQEAIMSNLDTLQRTMVSKLNVLQETMENLMRSQNKTDKSERIISDPVDKAELKSVRDENLRLKQVNADLLNKITILEQKKSQSDGYYKRPIEDYFPEIDEAYEYAESCDYDSNDPEGSFITQRQKLRDIMNLIAVYRSQRR